MVSNNSNYWDQLIKIESNYFKDLSNKFIQAEYWKMAEMIEIFGIPDNNMKKWYK